MANAWKCRMMCIKAMFRPVMLHVMNSLCKIDQQMRMLTLRKEYVHYLPAWKYSPFGCHMSDVNLTDGGLFG
jgi:hypothetical protein